MRKLRFLLVLLCVFLVPSTSFAENPACETVLKYTSCVSGRYLKYNGSCDSSSPHVGNECASCPSGCTCAGGTACPVCQTTVTITFRGGSNSMTQTCTSGSSVTLKAVSNMTSPVSSTYGWSFDGWATAAGPTTAVYDDGESITCPSSNTTLYGVWSRTVDLYYYGSASATALSNTKRTQYYRNTSTTAASPTSVTSVALTNSTYGWAPLGWRYDSAPASGVDVSQTGSSTTSLTPPADGEAAAYAFYSRTPQIAYDANGGEDSMNNSDCNSVQYYNAGGNATTDIECTLQDNGFPARSGYDFNGWRMGSPSGTHYDEGEEVTFPYSSWTSSKTYTAYADWVSTGVTITIDKNGGTGSLSIVTVSGDTPTVNSNSGTSDATVTCTPGAVFRVSGVSKSNATYDGLSTSSSGSGNSTITCPSSSGSTYYMIWSCDAGYYYNSGTCTACAKGTYKTSAGNATSCTTASSGYYVDTTAATSQTQCPSGYRSGSDSPRNAITDCYTDSCTVACSGNDTSSCPAHSTCTYNTSYTTSGTKKYYNGSCNASSSLCPVASYTCAAGYYKTSSGCSPCAKGTYKASAGNATSCTTADAGYYVNTTAATSQTQCPSGYRSGSDNGRDDITDCYTDSCTVACSGNDTSSCPSHATCTYNTSYTTSGTKKYYNGSCNVSASLCPVATVSCSSGYYLTNNNECDSCPSGCTCAGGTSQPDCPVSCDANEYLENNECHDCPSEFPYSEGGTHNIAWCYRDCVASDVTGAATVQSGGKRYSDNNGNTCRAASCNSGYYYNSSSGSCTLCSTVNNTTSQQSGTDTTSTSTCPDGSTIKANATATSQPYTRTCNGKYTGGAGGTSGSSACTGCSSYGSKSYGTCCATSCSNGYHVENCACVQDAPTSCPDGQYLNGNTCSNCTGLPNNATWTGSGTTATNCPWQCDANYYKSGSSCVACNVSFSNSCNVTNGTGTQTCYHTSSPAGSTSSSACTGTANCGSCCATTCTSGYHVENCACVQDAPTSCPDGQYLNGNTCSNCTGLPNNATWT
ncbi:MAG: InlB B-repeat-containing protein, partial [Alphaproteobacteria bacterium]|nr:InlB B-repeat-containing protein [Alphaproteobacteria bacterium]